MEITKKSFSEWFKSHNAQIAGNAMRVQWTALLENNNPFFSEDELWHLSPDIAVEGLIFALQRKPKLIKPALDLLQKRLSAAQALPFCLWSQLMNFASFWVENPDDKILIRDFVAKQHFDAQELNHMIDSALRCVDRMPEWQGSALTWIMLATPDAKFGSVIQRFLTEWGRLDECSNSLVFAAFDRILPEWAPLMIGALTNVPGAYRYDLSKYLFKKYFDNQPEEMTKAIIKCFDKDSDVDLQQKLLDGIFNFLNLKERKVELSTALVFVDGIKGFLINHWAENCFKFGNFWDKFYDAPEIFDIVRRALKNDDNFVLFKKGSEDKLAKLKTPMHMLCYLPVVNRVDLCLLLLRAVFRAQGETKDLACRILLEKEDSLQFDERFENILPKLEEILRFSYPISYEMKLFVSAITNALVKYGAKIQNFELLYDFVKSKELNVPAMEERYYKEIEALLRQRSYEKEVLDYLQKH